MANSTNPKIDPMSISGKLILKKKSGPGDLVGITEVVIKDGQVDFSELSFNEPGDYIISITSTSPDVDSGEFSIKVLPEDEVIAQEESKPQEDKKVEGTRPIISQIDQPTVVLPAIEIKRPPSNSDAETVAGGIGYTPFVNYNGAQIRDTDISNFKLYHNGILPKMIMLFRDTENLMKGAGAPNDNTKIEVFLNARSPNLKSIHLKFKIEEFKDLSDGTYRINGTLDISELYRIKYATYNGTSFEAIRNICRELKLGFNSNIENTIDSMPWRNTGMTQYSFIEDIIAHSYISDESFMVGYIDYYYCFNYVDVEKEMKRDNSSDIGVDTGNVEKDDIKDDSKLTQMILTNDKSVNLGSCFYFNENYKTQNNSGGISIKRGHRTVTKYYDKTKKMFLIFDVDSTTSDESKTTILKGAPGDKEEFDNNYTTKYLGKMDSDNVHKNYNYSVSQNITNLDTMSKMVLNIELSKSNFNLYKYQKIEVNMTNVQPTPTDTETVRWRYSGSWIISDIIYIFDGSVYTQKVSLIRKEIGKNPQEMKENTTEAKKETKEESHENPSNENKPNLAYKVGEIYTVQGTDGKKYTLVIKSLSEDGDSVTTNLKEI